MVDTRGMVGVGRREGWWEEEEGRDGGSREEGGMVGVGRREGWWQ